MCFFLLPAKRFEAVCLMSASLAIRLASSNSEVVVAERPQVKVGLPETQCETGAFPYE